MAQVLVGGRPGRGEEQRIPPSKTSRPNYNALHARPLPLQVNPLPQLIPHNPLSLLYFAYTYISYLLSPPSSHTVKYHGYFSPETRSVHITEIDAVRGLWENGFFGKGSLSRSEPSWLDREKRRRGIIIGETSEEITKKRRKERKEFKKERARKEREAIEQKLQEESKLGSNEHTITVQMTDRNGDPTNPNLEEIEGSQTPIVSREEPKVPGDTARKDSSIVINRTEQSSLEAPSRPPASSTLHVDNHSLALIKDEEHLQLSLEEAFFLNYGLGALEISYANFPVTTPTNLLFSLFRQYSYFPPREAQDLQPDDPFLISYVVYHHFRSLGWVVRSGVKFAVDYLLYNRGPAFSHAEFALLVLPLYSHPYWHATEEREAAVRKKESKSWWWLHSVNRVQSQVRKSLVLVYVEVPPPPQVISSPILDSLQPVKGGRSTLDIGQTLKQYKVREFSLKRWIPNRSRD
ncbi:hypothetical protein MMC14_002996 [Varicellaria rhodocarpa]|nr:hypothetical protein [Varicellaria rhodocarpa]